MIEPQSLQDLTVQFAESFSNKDAAAIGKLMQEDFSLYDPSLKWISGKQAVLAILEQQFRETENVSYQVVRLYQAQNTTIMEFVITLDSAKFVGVDFIEWNEGKMSMLRCYYNPPDKSADK